MAMLSMNALARSVRTVTAASLITASSVLWSAAQAGGLFTEMAGSWRGEGSVTWSTGETEILRCLATYEVDAEGNKIEQDMTCATDTTKLVVKSTISFRPAAGAIVGTWSERTYGVNGRVSGSASQGKINALVQSGDKKFTARVAVITRGKEQTVTISPQDIELAEVSVVLRKSG
jgi:hypothetical protein